MVRTSSPPESEPYLTFIYILYIETGFEAHGFISDSGSLQISVLLPFSWLLWKRGESDNALEGKRPPGERRSRGAEELGGRSPQQPAGRDRKQRVKVRRGETAHEREDTQEKTHDGASKSHPWI